ncbi:MAG: YggS family pyridoxal phosphate-dependent enzyme [Dehalococcoidia bacterium]|nr:YggS family pyridoxal phosphate-dependent enzyme [Dehalococcoidia bacterium]
MMESTTVTQIPIKDNLERIKSRIAAAAERAGRRPDEVTLIGATKTVPPDLIDAAVTAGLRHLGENRVQEAAPKHLALAGLHENVTWHMIGSLQSNKIRQALDTFDVIQTLDSLKLADSIARRVRDTVNVLLEVNVAGEPTKSGFTPEEVEAALRHIRSLPELKVLGLMTVAPAASDASEVRPVFRKLREMRDALGLKDLSMGMTDDFEVAVEEGATMVRIGRAIFGARPT